MLEWNQQSKLTFFEWGGKHNKFKPKPQNMQSRIKNCDKKISLSTYLHHGAAAKTTREREKGKTPTPIHTKIHTSSRALWLIGRRVGLGYWGNENQIGKRVVFSEWVWGFVVVLAEGREWFSVRRVDCWGGLDLGWSKIEYSIVFVMRYWESPFNTEDFTFSLDGPLHDI